MLEGRGQKIMVVDNDRTVLELLETVEPGSEVVSACRKMKALGISARE